MSDEKEIRWVGSAYNDLWHSRTTGNRSMMSGPAPRRSAFGKQAHLLAAAGTRAQAISLHANSACQQFPLTQEALDLLRRNRRVEQVPLNLVAFVQP